MKRFMTRNFNLPPGANMRDIDPPEVPESREDDALDAADHERDVVLSMPEIAPLPPVMSREELAARLGANI